MRARRDSLLLLPLLLLGLLLAGCMNGEKVKALPETVVGTLPKQTTTASTGPKLKGDPVAGKKIFQSAGCTGCHTLKDAGSTGTVGPNLDDAKPSASRAVQRVTNGAGQMPPFKGQLTDQQIADVAAYVAKASGGDVNG
jgi:mono/diheme cytochrome c family protein